MSHRILLDRLLSLGWKAPAHSYQYVRVEHPDGRHGQLPFANAPTKQWHAALWARIKKDLRLQGEEIYGRPR